MPDKKTSIITLHSGTASMALQATAKTDGSATTVVTTREPDKGKMRGMTGVHKTMDAAIAHITTLGEQAEKLGWRRRVTAAQPDQFSKLPAPPQEKAAPKEGK